MSQTNPADPAPAPPRHTQLRFFRPDLEGLPEPDVPAGYTLRRYQPGDEEGWAAVLRASFDNDPGWTPERIRKEFLDHDLFRPERIIVVEGEGGRIAGVSGAWQRDDPACGYVHWVGVDPAHQGKKLGRLVVLETLRQFRREGKTRAILDTDEFRTAACATYLRLGFQPLLDSEERKAMWKRVQTDLGMNPDGT